jgi:hypothetical protein
MLHMNPTLLCLYDVPSVSDICKQGQNPYSGMVTELQSGGNLPPSWECVAAPRTYNPLGNMVTFLSVDDIVQAVGRLCSK